jgi:hypothetical protein
MNYIMKTYWNLCTFIRFEPLVLLFRAANLVAFLCFHEWHRCDQFCGISGNGPNLMPHQSLQIHTYLHHTHSIRP